MKNIKMIFWVVILVFIGLIFFQNKEFFIGGQSFGVNLWFQSYHTPELPNGVYFLIFFLAGLLISYVSNLFTRFKHAKTVKSLNNTIKASQDQISSLEHELLSFKTVPSSTNEVPSDNNDKKDDNEGSY